MKEMDENEQRLREKHRVLVANTVPGFKMDSASRAYHFDEGAFDTAADTVITDMPELSGDDQKLLRDIILADAWPQLKEAHASMRTSTYAHLRELNPATICPDASFAMDIGWRELLQRAATRVESYPASWRARIAGSKEKLGALVVFLNYDYSARGCRSEVDRMLEEIRLSSLATCEICGQPGRLRLAGYAKTVCERHSSIMGQMREDDGVLADAWKWRDNDEYRDSAAELLQDMDPVRARPKGHVVDLMPQSDIGRQIEHDTFGKLGRQQDLLIEFPHARREGMESLQRFFGEVGGLQEEADKLDGHKRELLRAYAGDLADSARGSLVKEEYVDDYVRAEVDLWPDVLTISQDDKEWLRSWLLQMIRAEYARIRRKHSKD